MLQRAPVRPSKPMVQLKPRMDPPLRSRVFKSFEDGQMHPRIRPLNGSAKEPGHNAICASSPIHRYGSYAPWSNQVLKKPV